MALQHLARRLLVRWSLSLVVQMGLYLTDAQRTRHADRWLIIYLVSSRLERHARQRLRFVTRSWSEIARSRTAARQARAKMGLRRERRTLMIAIRILQEARRSSRGILLAVDRSIMGQLEAYVAAVLCCWIAVVHRRHRKIQAQHRGQKALLNFSMEVVREVILRWQKACALRNSQGAGLDGDTAAGVALMRCIVGASAGGYHHTRQMPDWAVRRLAGFMDSSSALAIPDLVVSMDRYIRRVISKWFAVELLQVEVRINQVQDVVRHAGVELRRYRLVQNATEERLHRRIAQLEATMLAMFSQTALQAGVEQARLIEPELNLSPTPQVPVGFHSPSDHRNATLSPPSEAHEGTAACARLSPAKSPTSPLPPGHDRAWRPAESSLSMSAIERSLPPSPHFGSAGNHFGSPLTSTRIPSSSQSPLGGSGTKDRIASSADKEGCAGAYLETACSTSHRATSVPGQGQVGSDGEQPSSGSTGIGLLLERRGAARVLVKSVRPGGPADKCGVVKIGDELESVNEVSVGGLALESIHDIIHKHKQAGGAIELQLVRRGALPNQHSVRFVARTAPTERA